MGYVTVLLHAEHATRVFQLIQAEVLVLELVHATQWVTQHLAQQNAHRTAMHANQHRFLFWPAQYQIQHRLLPCGHQLGALPSFYTQTGFAFGPGL